MCARVRVMTRVYVRACARCECLFVWRVCVQELGVFRWTLEERHASRAANAY
jgi:hypothetical protein